MEEAGMNNIFKSYEDKTKLHQDLANEVATLLVKAINIDGFAILALSGGSTPKPFFEVLSKIKLNWNSVYITLVDDRWVDNMHADSNEKLVREFLLKNNAKEATFISLKNDADTPFGGLKECNEKLKQFKKPIDVVVLGMGNDGHTASFFPKDENLNNALSTNEICAATIPSDAPHQRITLSLNTILKAKHLFLHIEGETKKEVYFKALEDGLITQMPIRAILNDKKELKVYYGE